MLAASMVRYYGDSVDTEKGVNLDEPLALGFSIIFWENQCQEVGDEYLSNCVSPLHGNAVLVLPTGGSYAWKFGLFWCSYQI